MNKDILSVQEALVNPNLIQQQSFFSDYKTFPLWGRPVVKESDHFLNKFFSYKFSCKNFKVLNNPLISNLPKNLYTTHPQEIGKEILDFVSQSVSAGSFSLTSDLFKQKLAASFISHVIRHNASAMNKTHSGESLSRGCLGEFLLEVSAKFLVNENQLTLIDKAFVKEYLFLLEDKIRLRLTQEKLAA